METHASHSSSDEFMSEVKAVSGAEERAKGLLDAAKIEAQRIVSAAQAKAVGIESDSSERALEAKNGIITSERAKSEKRIGQLMHNAGQKAGELAARRLGERVISEISQSI